MFHRRGVGYRATTAVQSRSGAEPASFRQLQSEMFVEWLAQRNAVFCRRTLTISCGQNQQAHRLSCAELFSVYSVLFHFSPAYIQHGSSPTARTQAVGEEVYFGVVKARGPSSDPGLLIYCPVLCPLIDLSIKHDLLRYLANHGTCNCRSFEMLTTKPTKQPTQKNSMSSFHGNRQYQASNRQLVQMCVLGCLCQLLSHSCIQRRIYECIRAFTSDTRSIRTTPPLSPSSLSVICTGHAYSRGFNKQIGHFSCSPPP